MQPAQGSGQPMKSRQLWLLCSVILISLQASATPYFSAIAEDPSGNTILLSSKGQLYAETSPGFFKRSNAGGLSRVSRQLYIADGKTLAVAARTPVFSLGAEGAWQRELIYNRGRTIVSSGSKQYLIIRRHVYRFVEGQWNKAATLPSNVVSAWVDPSGTLYVSLRNRSIKRVTIYKKTKRRQKKAKLQSLTTPRGLKGIDSVTLHGGSGMALARYSTPTSESWYLLSGQTLTPIAATALTNGEVLGFAKKHLLVKRGDKLELFVVENDAIKESKLIGAFPSGVTAWHQSSSRLLIGTFDGKLFSYKSGTLKELNIAEEGAKDRKFPGKAPAKTR